MQQKLRIEISVAKVVVFIGENKKKNNCFQRRKPLETNNNFQKPKSETFAF